MEDLRKFVSGVDLTVLRSTFSDTVYAVWSILNGSLVMKLVSGLAVGVASLGTGLYIYTRLTCGVCTCTTDLTGKTAIVTGSNTGIGYYTALDFAKRHARVIVAGRNYAKIEAAAYAIRAKTGNPNVFARLLDVSLMKSVHAFVKDFQAEEERLDILVNNAGMIDIYRDLTRTEEGLELVMATNHLGPFLLTKLLLDKMKKCPSSRIINVSSIGHRFSKLDVDNMNAEKNFDKKIIYSDTKLCNILFTRELDHRLQGTGVTTYSLYPGAVVTDIWRTMKWPASWVLKILAKISFKSSEEGAQTTIHCAVAPGLEKHSGKYFADCKLANPSKLSKDAALARNVWATSERLVSL